MDGIRRGTALLGAATFGLTMVAQSAAMADSASQQKNKNLWRNLAIGAGVIAGHGLITHNGTETLLGLGGAAYSANRYEQDRKHQSQQNSWRQRYHRTDRHYYYNNGYNNGASSYRSYSTTSSGYPNYYPNIKYFRQNGHVYYKNLDTGQVELSQW
jgi:hypothetical protein